MLFASPGNAAGILYDVDFSNDVVGTVPAIHQGEFPRRGPSGVQIPDNGGAIVTDGVGSLLDKPLLWDPGTVPGFYYQPIFGDLDARSTTLDQILCPSEEFDPGVCDGRLSSTRHVDIQFKTEIFSLAPIGGEISESSFGVLIDTPSVTRFDFNSDGSLTFYRGSGARIPIGTFGFDTALLVRLSIDLDRRAVAMLINGNQVYSGTFAAYGVTAVRFALATNSYGKVAVDDIMISAVPEPSVALLVSIGLVGLACHDRRFRTRDSI